MANNSLIYKDSMFDFMLLQINTQAAQQEIMRNELQVVKDKLAQADKTLAQKNQIIGSLEQDLEHLLDQLGKMQHNYTANVSAVAQETSV